MLRVGFCSYDVNELARIFAKQRVWWEYTSNLYVSLGIRNLGFLIFFVLKPRFRLKSMTPLAYCVCGDFGRIATMRIFIIFVLGLTYSDSV